MLTYQVGLLAALMIREQAKTLLTASHSAIFRIAATLTGSETMPWALMATSKTLKRDSVSHLILEVQLIRVQYSQAAHKTHNTMKQVEAATCNSTLVAHFCAWALPQQSKQAGAPTHQVKAWDVQ